MFITPVGDIGWRDGQPFHEGKPVRVLLYRRREDYRTKGNTFEEFLIAPNQADDTRLKGPSKWVPMDEVQWR